MQLDKLQISTRPKNSWQCFDLGSRVALLHYRALISIWLVISLPVMLVSVLISPAYGFFAFWLLKPLFERALLYYLSRVVFGEKTTLKQTLKAWPSQMKPMWFSSITFRRFAPSRSFNTAVTQLERLTGARRQKRLSTLHYGQPTHASWWTVCCAHWEGFLQLGLLAFFQIMLPADWGLGSVSDFYFSGAWEADAVLNIVVYSAATIVAPFYVAGGFISYLNKRVLLEGWDIELGFKRWSKEAQETAIKRGVHNKTNKTKTPASTLSVAVLALCFFSLQLGVTDTALAQEQPKLDAPYLPNSDKNKALLAEQQKRKKEIEEKLQETFQEPPFGYTEESIGYRFKFDESEEVETDAETYSLAAAIAKWIASSLEVLLWAGFIFIMAVIIYINRHLLSSFFTRSNTQVTDDLVMPSFVSATYQEKLPDDVVSAVNKAIGDKQYRLAISILLRASLTELSQAQKLRITKSMTETECLRLIQQNCSVSVFDNMKALLHTWMDMAWAHRLPSPDTLIMLNQSYEATFVNGNLLADDETTSARGTHNE